MCPGLILGRGSGSFTSFTSLSHLPQICGFIWLSSVAFLSLCVSLFFIAPLIPLYLLVSQLPHPLSLLTLSYIFIHSFSYFLPFSFHLSILRSSSQPRVPQALHCRHHAPPPPWAPPLSHWHHTLLPSPENHFKQPAPSKPTVSQPGSQSASQPAFCFDLKLLSSQSQGCFPLLIHIKDPLKLPKFAF